ncbi:hypothetical protein NIES4073_14170 [Kalymmatonema gypsitolerans NIES-4073]|jgi:hypothetical protein|nr:hypothetical protein NIES4073_14170 [Scytonema sp. NIES-4073]
MQDELKNVISEAINNSTEFEQEQITPIAEELSDEALEAVAGGVCITLSFFTKPCLGWSFLRNANNKV